MPTMPRVKVMTASPQNAVAAIFADQPEMFAGAPPIENTSESIREIGSFIFNYQPRQNAFLSALVNRIGMVLITSKLYSNPLRSFKRGMLEFGETVEEIFVDIGRAYQFNPEIAETTIFKRVIPDVKAAYHQLNFQKFYKQTISNDQLRQAFLSWRGIDDLIAKIVDGMYTAMNYDEFIVMKYMIAVAALNGNMYPQNIPALNAENAKAVVTAVKGISNTLEFMHSEYNMAGVHTYTDKREQIVLINSSADALIDVEVLASAFNMDKAEFMGRRVLVDSFSAIDNERLSQLFESDPTYVPLTTEEIKALDSIPVIIVDEKWWMIFDHYMNMTEQYNGEGLYWNYWLHCWRIFSISPFANAVLFTSDTPAITSVTVSPATATAVKGQTIQLSANVVTTGFAPKSVIWSSSSENSKVNSTGAVTITDKETSATVTITATSVYDNSKSGTSTITISGS